MDAALKPDSASSSHRVDPVTTEIVRNGLIAATEEMKTNLMRTAYNMFIYEALDFTVGLFDARGNTPLATAARCGNTAVVRCLVEHGASVNASDGTAGSPFLLAELEVRPPARALAAAAPVDVEHGEPAFAE